jgi:hypothetical protein
MSDGTAGGLAVSRRLLAPPLPLCTRAAGKEFGWRVGRTRGQANEIAALRTG